MNLSGLSNLFVVVLFVALVLVAVISARVRRGGAEKVTQMPTRAPGPFAWPPSSLSASRPGDGVDVAGMRDEAQIIRGVRASGRGPCWRCSGNRGAKVKYNWTDGPNWYSGFRWEPCGACLATAPWRRGRPGRVRADLPPGGWLGAHRAALAAADRGLHRGDLRRLVRGQLAAAGGASTASRSAGAPGPAEDRWPANRLLTAPPTNRDPASRSGHRRVAK
jgi:hypothetical protein